VSSGWQLQEILVLLKAMMRADSQVYSCTTEARTQHVETTSFVLMFVLLEVKPLFRQAMTLCSQYLLTEACMWYAGPVPRGLLQNHLGSLTRAHGMHAVCLTSSRCCWMNWVMR
jgi:hypothetical protein